MKAQLCVPGATGTLLSAAVEECGSSTRPIDRLMSVSYFTCIKKTHPCSVCGGEHLCLIIFLNFCIFAVQVASGHLLTAVLVFLYP